jgi:site-specific DNA-methyltransferase (adenine-specific)
MKEFKLKQEDAITYLKSLPNESCDLMITDPAYESLEKWRAIGTTTSLAVIELE